MKYRSVILSLLLLVATWAWGASSAQAYSSYYVYDTWGGTWSDADKTFANTEDDYMCWAASASNILAWTGWGDVYSTNADAIFAYFQDYWTDAGGSAYVGWYWWFSGVNVTQGDDYAAAGWSQVDVAGGGGFWTGYSLSNYFLYTSEDAAALWAIEYLFDNDYGVSLGIATASGKGHALTCWGYQYDERGNIVGIYVTDSDDKTEQLAYYAVTYKNGEWYLQNFYGTSNTWYITEVLGLAECAVSTLAMHTVPEPMPLLLLGFGLVGLVALKRKFGTQ